MGMMVSPGRFGGADEAAFNAHIATRATSGVMGWSAGVSPGLWRTTAAAAVGLMYNTPWGSMIYQGDTLARAIQHGLPSEAVFNALVAAGRQIFVRIIDAGGLIGASAVTRNGYTSVYYYDGTSYASVYLVELAYWLDDQAWTVSPTYQSGPSLYVL